MSFESMFLYVLDSAYDVFKFFYAIFVSFFPGTVQQKMEDYLNSVDIKINGSRPHDLVVKDPAYFAKTIVTHYMTGFGKGYVDGLWHTVDDPEGIIEFFNRFIQTSDLRPYEPWHSRLHNWIGYTLINRQTKELSKQVARNHYDLGNDFFASFLDKNMVYTCAYWKTAKDLEQAQIDKMDLIARKLKLKPGMKVLDLGCGFGTIAKHLAENYGVSVVAYNISAEQVKYARMINQGLPVDVRMEDYRNVTGVYDRIYSIGLLEHVGRKNYRGFFELTNRCLADDGLQLIHAITMARKGLANTNQWTSTEIFAHGQLPYPDDYLTEAQDLFIIEDMHNFGYDYYLTLVEWGKRFRQNWPKFQAQYGEKFYRLWNLYLTFSAGWFKSRRLSLFQVVYSKTGVKDGYISER